MSIFLTLAFLFFMGSVLGWVLELLFRRFFSRANPERKWINPGFLVGPYVPLYGFGLCGLFLLARLENLHWIENPVLSRIMLLLTMAVAMTAIEYLAGVLCLKVMKVRLWDYSDQWGNLNGLICPKFSLAWALLGAVYVFFVHPYILDALRWLSENLAFSFFIGMFFGVLIIDFAYSTRLVVRIKAFAKDNDVIVRYEHLKAYIRQVHDANKTKAHFLLPFRSDRPVSEHLRQYLELKKQRHEKVEHIIKRDRKTRGEKPEH